MTQNKYKNKRIVIYDIFEWFNQIDTKLILGHVKVENIFFLCLVDDKLNGLIKNIFMYIPNDWPMERIKSAILQGIKIY